MPRLRCCHRFSHYSSSTSLFSERWEIRFLYWTVQHTSVSNRDHYFSPRRSRNTWQFGLKGRGHKTNLPLIYHTHHLGIQCTSICVFRLGWIEAYSWPFLGSLCSIVWLFQIRAIWHGSIYRVDTILEWFSCALVYKGSHNVASLFIRMGIVSKGLHQ